MPSLHLYDLKNFIVLNSNISHPKLNLKWSTSPWTLSKCMIYTEINLILDVYEYHSPWSSLVFSAALQTLILALEQILEPKRAVLYYKTEHSSLTPTFLLLHSALCNANVNWALKTLILWTHTSSRINGTQTTNSNYSNPRKFRSKFITIF